MSASNKKKLRKEEAQGKLTQRQLTASQEAKKQKRSTVTFWIVIALCLCITLGAVLTNPIKNMVYRNTKAVEVGDYTLSAVELNYFYVDAVSQFYSNYSSYISYLLNPKTPLDQQVYNATTGQTWADYFVDQAYNSIKSTYAVYDLAMKDETYSLSDTARSSLENAMMYTNLYATIYGYKSVTDYLIDMYGPGATEESYRAYYEKCLVAEEYYTKYSESLEYSAEDLSNYHTEHTGEFSSYTFAYFFLSVSKFYPADAGTLGEDGKTKVYTAEETAAAIAAAKAAAEELAKGNYSTLDEFDFAINNLPIHQEKEEDKKDESTDKEDESNKTDGEERTVDESTGDDTTGDDTIGDDTTGDDTIGDDTTGDDTTGDDTTGDDATGDDTTGDDTTGDDTTGDDTTGDDTTGDDDKEEEKPTYKYSSTKKEDVLYSSISLGSSVSTTEVRNWLIGKIVSENEDEDPTFEVRVEGDMIVIESSTGEGEEKTINGYYVVRYGSFKDNNYIMKNVRHILVKFQQLKEDGTVDTNSKDKEFSEAEKKAAEDEANKLYQDWLAGDKTEDSFAELANKESDDGNGTTGGLYENVYMGQMVEPFEKWCYDEARQPGDHAVIETEYGWHIMYFVGNTELTYRDYMIQETIRLEDVNEWYNGLIAAIPFTVINSKYINKGMSMT